MCREKDARVLVSVLQMTTPWDTVVASGSNCDIHVHASYVADAKQGLPIHA